MKDPSGNLSIVCLLPLCIQLNFVRCDQCGEGFIQGEGLKRHVLRHKINEGTLTEEEKQQLELAKKPCEFCGRKFADPSALKRHLKSHMGIKDYACTECGKAYSEKRARDNHYNIVHLGVKNFPCDHCGKLFGRYNSLTAHMKTTHSIGNPTSSNPTAQVGIIEPVFINYHSIVNFPYPFAQMGIVLKSFVIASKGICL